MLPVAPLLARCVVCVAEEKPYGWYVIGGTVLLGSVLIALFFAWQDQRARRHHVIPDDSTIE
ncbi:MAG: hypothetical protein ACOYOB_13140 [Myxococcota bacterium]